jgi:hypothetical protein
MRDHEDDGHCHGPECFQDAAAAVDVCACDCPRCVQARERLLAEQGEGDEPEPHGDPSGNGGGGPIH